MTITMDATIGDARRHTIGDLPRRAAQRSPDKLAIVCGETRWSYAEFNAVCNRVGNHLLGLGIGKCDRVAVLSRNSHAFAALRFALARIGAVLVPINFMLKSEEVAFVLRSSGARMLAVGPEFVDTARDAAARGTAVTTFLWLPGATPAAAPGAAASFDELARPGAESPPDIAVDSRDLAQILYTSGTESLPKGALLTHEAVLWQYASCIIEGEMAESDLHLHSLPLYHCAQLDVFLGPSIYLGATNIIIGQPAPDTILEHIERHRVSSYFAPPTVWIGMLRSPRFDRTDLSSLKKGYYGASIMPVEVLREIQRRLPQVRPRGATGRNRRDRPPFAAPPHWLLQRAR
jgi:fatty-acyl-CoA synthase